MKTKISRLECPYFQLLVFGEVARVSVLDLDKYFAHPTFHFKKVKSRRFFTRSYAASPGFFIMDVRIQQAMKLLSQAMFQLGKL